MEIKAKVSNINFGVFAVIFVYSYMLDQLTIF